jgi:hypothetical integral membrane protein (TIGR02206 family)
LPLITAGLLPAPGTRAGDEFINFSLTHAVTAAACLLVMVSLAVAGRCCRGGRWQKPLHWGWIIFVAAVQFANIAYYAIFVRQPPDDANPLPHVDWSVALPLQICDLAGLLAAPALILRSRLLKTILYYWAIGLTTQAFLTPTLGYGPIHLRFWLFWLSHLTITASAVYFLAAEGYRPTWRDFRNITLVMLAYGAFIIPLDIAFGFNYGFLGKANDLGTRTLLDYLGPWPWRLVSLFFAVETVFAILTVVWWRPSRNTAPADPNTQL